MKCPACSSYDTRASFPSSTGDAHFANADCGTCGAKWTLVTRPESGSLRMRENGAELSELETARKCLRLGMRPRDVSSLVGVSLGVARALSDDLGRSASEVA